MPKRDLNEVEEDDDSVAEEVFSKAKVAYTNKQRVLILSSRGITARYRHLLEDLKKLIPHHKKDNKLDDKGDIHAVNEIADMKSCNQIIYLETRKHQDLYMYLGKTPEGPSVKFHVVNIHTMDELKLTGNCMLGSRPLLNFDANFNNSPQFQLMKSLLSDAFGTPMGHPKSKPFNDRVMSFFVVKNNICKCAVLFAIHVFCCVPYHLVTYLVFLSQGSATTRSSTRPTPTPSPATPRRPTSPSWWRWVPASC